MGRELRTRLCHELGIEYPIFSAGIGHAAGPELVAAVSNAGGFGVMGASGMAPDEMGGLIQRVHELTRRPFGVNIIIEETEEGDRALLVDAVAAAGAHGAAAVTLFWGDPSPCSNRASRPSQGIHTGRLSRRSSARRGSRRRRRDRSRNRGGRPRERNHLHLGALAGHDRRGEPLAGARLRRHRRRGGSGARASDGCAGRIAWNSLRRER